MIKPKPVGLLALDEEIKESYYLHQKYKEKLISDLLSTYEARTLEDLIVVLCEKFHPSYIEKNKRGAKTKWNEYLCALLAFEIKRKMNEGKLKKTAIYEIVRDPLWCKLGKNSKDIFGLFAKAEKSGSKSNFYPVIKDYYSHLEYKSELHEWSDLLQSTIKKAINN
jgi:hypothetical protein